MLNETPSQPRARVSLDALPEAIDVSMPGWGIPADQREQELATYRASLGGPDPIAHLFAARIDGDCRTAGSCR